MSRIKLLILLITISVIEIGPIPFTPLLLIWVVLIRPKWFYDLVLNLYGKIAE